MSYQQVETEISNYFDELFSGNQHSIDALILQQEQINIKSSGSATTAKEPTAKEPIKPAVKEKTAEVLKKSDPDTNTDSERFSTKHKKETTESKLEKQQPQQNPFAISNDSEEGINRSVVKTINTKTIDSANTKKTEPAAIESNKSETTEKKLTQSLDDQSSLESKKTSQTMIPSTLDKQSNDTFTLKSTSNTIDLEKQQTQIKASGSLKTDTPSESTRYAEHKQRLEKMLEKVSELNSPSTTVLDSSLTTAPEFKTNELKDSNPLLDDEISSQILPILSSEWLDNGRPNWAQEPFDILLIEVNGLKLALPLTALGQIQSLDEDLTPLFGQSDWFMGLQKSPMGNIKTVNTAKFVMPERYQEDNDYKFVVSINGLQWGLAVDCIHQPINVDPDSIRWRVKRSSRPWMAGMVKDHMCVLLDIPSMGEILQSQDKNHQ